MRFQLLLPFFVLLSCTPDEPVEETGAIMEYKIDEDSLTVANGGVVSRDISHEVQVVQDFFAISDEIMTDDFCYDREKLLQVVIDGKEDEHGWHKYMIEDEADYFTADHYECYSEIAFKTFDFSGEKRAYLSLSNKNFQEFKYLEQDQEGKWFELNEAPYKPNYTDFFESLTNEEAALVNEYGYYYIYLGSRGDTLDYVFSDWEMGMRMGEKGVGAFSKEADFSFSVVLDEGEFLVVKKPLQTDTITVE